MTRLMDIKCSGCKYWDYDKNRCSAFMCHKDEGTCILSEVPSSEAEIDSALKKKSLTQDDINDIIKETEITTMTMFNKTTIVVAKLPSGFVIVESSSCVSSENYDLNMGVDICMKKIEDKIWELEGYALQKKLGGEKNAPK